MNSTATTILWVYTTLLLVGGLIGFLKAGSKMSLIASVAFAIPLALTAAHRLPASVGWILTAVLGAVFARRWGATKHFMPGGLMCLLSLATAIALGVLIRA